MHNRRNGEGDKSESHGSLVGIVQHVGGEALPVLYARISDRARIYNIALAVLYCEILRIDFVDRPRLACEIDAGNMRMADKSEARVNRGKIDRGIFLAFNVVELFGFRKITMCRNRFSERDCIREGRENIARFRGQHFAVSQNGVARKIYEVVFIYASGNGVVVVSGNDCCILREKKIERFGGKRSVSHDITETDDALGSVSLGVVENLSQGRFVRVDIGYDGVDHSLKHFGFSGRYFLGEDRVYQLVEPERKN